MASKRHGETVQISARMPADWVKELDAIAEHLSRPGIEISQAEALRSCVRRGLDLYSAELKKVKR